MDLLFFRQSETSMEKELNNTTPMPDLTDMEEVRKAVIASEIINRKY